MERVQYVGWERTGSRTAENKGWDSTVRKLEAAEAAVLEDLLGDETTMRQAARVVFA